MSIIIMLVSYDPVRRKLLSGEKRTDRQSIVCGVKS